jgi:hypothetical protein
MAQSAGALLCLNVNDLRFRRGRRRTKKSGKLVKDLLVVREECPLHVGSLNLRYTLFKVRPVPFEGRKALCFTLVVLTAAFRFMLLPYAAAFLLLASDPHHAL